MLDFLFLGYVVYYMVMLFFVNNILKGFSGFFDFIVIKMVVMDFIVIKILKELFFGMRVVRIEIFMFIFGFLKFFDIFCIR